MDNTHYAISQICNALRAMPIWARFLATLMLLLSLAPQLSQAQRKVTILEADSIRGGNFQGQRIQRIIGNVHLQGKSMEMYCDSAYQFTNKSKIRAFGNIQINTDTEKIWADSLTYFTDIDFSELRGRVIIEADSTTLFGNSVDYRFSTRIAHFIDKIRLEDQRGTLVADSGYYYRQADSAKFRGHVQISDSLQYLEGDSLFSNRETKYYELYGNVYGNDQENESMIHGDYLESDSTGRRLLKGKAWLQNFETDTTDTAQTDTTHIRAKIIRSIEHESPTDTSTIVRGYENVRIWSPTFSAVGDTTIYTDSTNTFEIWSNAKSWHEQVQLTGPYIQAQIKNGDIDSLKSYPRPFSVQQDTSLDRLNQITGDTLHADFKEGSLRQIYVFGDAKLLRFTKNKQGQPDGAIDLTAPDIRIFFKNGQINKMEAVGSIDGSYLPESEKTTNRRLDGFSWNPDLRPHRPKKDMERRFSSIPDSIFFALPRRYIKHLKKVHPNSRWLQSSEPKEQEKVQK